MKPLRAVWKTSATLDTLDVTSMKSIACILFATLLLSGCGTIATAAVVTGAVVGAATTVAGVAVDGVVLVGKGVVKSGEVIVDAVKDDPPAKP
jgi:uncharacterized protein YceK